jgi:hypothetical protein
LLLVLSLAVVGRLLGGRGGIIGCIFSVLRVAHLFTLPTPCTWLTIDAARSFDAALETVPESVTSPWTVAAVMRSFLRAVDASRACTTSISICPSLRCPAAGAASFWATAIAQPRANTAAHARARGKILLSVGRFIVVISSA